MKTVQEALEIVLENVPAAPVEELPLENAMGYVLAETVLSDINMPPFNKSAMDGYAVRSSDVKCVPAELLIVDTVVAGDVASKQVGEGECIKIMTGAPVPEGADAVVRVEDSSQEGPTVVKILVSCCEGDNVCAMGEDLRASSPALEAGSLIRPQEILVLASSGASRVKVFQKPSIGFFATGSELVPIFERPAGGAIRNTNSSLIAARLSELGMPFRNLGIAQDREELLRAKVREGLFFDFLLLTGGVSMGEYDIVAEALQNEGVELFFDTLALRPGKPFTFGRKGDTLAFGLPGNPVTVFVCFELFVRPAILKRSGWKNPVHQFLKIPYKGREKKIKKNGRDIFFPALLTNHEGALSVTLVEWHGSGDVVGLSRCNCLLHLHPGTKGIAPGELHEVLPV